ncbi:hypothetical protein [Actinophytocola sp. KF-1]
MTNTVAVRPPEDSPPLETDNRERADAPDEWGRQSFPASDPPQNW